MATLAIVSDRRGERTGMAGIGMRVSLFLAGRRRCRAVKQIAQGYLQLRPGEGVAVLDTVHDLR